MYPIDLSGKNKDAATLAAINGMLLLSEKDTAKLLAELQKLLKKLGTGKRKPKAKRYGFLFALYPTLEIEKKGGGI